MTVPSWPSDVPSSPILGSWNFQPQDNRVYYPVEIGPPMTAPRGSAPGGKASMSIMMTKAELADFLTFFASDLKHGSLAFTMEDPMTETTATWKFGQDPYQVRAEGQHLRAVSLNLIRLS